MTFPSITLKGNILTFDLLEEVANGTAAKSTARDYGYANKNQLQQAIADAWADANIFHQAFSNKLGRLTEDDPAVTETRGTWVVPLLQSLGYEPIYNRRHLEIDERTYAISHGDDSLGGFPIHIIGANQSLDRRSDGMRLSPHALVQEYLNRDPNLYAIVTNGRFLRILRDSSQLTRQSYVEFDLSRIFAAELFADFALLFRLLHRSRVPASPEEGNDSIIEKYHVIGLEKGSAIRSKLSEAVEKGIIKLGGGLLADKDNKDLRTWVESTDGAADLYYEHLLKLIYRLLFVMVIEERDLIFPRTAKEEDEQLTNDTDSLKFSSNQTELRNRRIYYDFYSVGRLRKLAHRRQLANDREYDLWENLLNTFRLFENDGSGEKLGIAPLAGDLFRPEALGPLTNCRINNKVLLETLRGLSEYDNGQGGMITVNYANLDVEEFGSVYEGLLEFAPVIDETAWTFDFVDGTERSSSGSHYTPDELVQPLIKHSLEHLIADRTCAPDAPEHQRKEAIRQLLSLTVCDVACGSGHILLAAARRIGLEVARLRSTEEQPNPTDLRRGTRAAIRHCIYGVDKNPLAVELCKVALWLEAHVPGEPLGFLDHRIRNGDAIVGLGRMEELQNGIATEAFKAYGNFKVANPEEKAELTATEKTNVANLKKRNKLERTKREKSGGLVQGGLFQELNPVTDRLERYQRRFAEFSKLPERTVAEIETKEKAYQKAINNEDAWFIQGLADLQVAQFFVPKLDTEKVVTDEQYFDIMHGRTKQSRAEAIARAESVERKFFHWFLAFPEVFTERQDGSESGFDCVLGNPPFLGNRKISGSFGSNYLEYIKNQYDPIGSVDLVTYFFRRIFNSLKFGGFQSLISTNTIAQGDARAGGLAVIRNQGGTINHAVRSMKWPGLAAVEVALLTIFKGNWTRELILDQISVIQITTYLDDQEYLGDPFKLKRNTHKSFQGSIVLGKGFVLEPEDAHRLIEKDQKNKEVLFPYLNGNDLNGRPDQSPSRWIINFFDWPERRLSLKEWESLDIEVKNRIIERIESGKTIEQAPPNYNGSVAIDYLECYEILEQLVKPERTRWKTDKSGKELIGQYALRKPLPIRWWMYGDKRPELYTELSKKDTILVISGQASKFPLFVEVSCGYVYSHSLSAITESCFYELVNSSFHNAWCYKYGSLLESRLRYSPSDLFETYPFPNNCWTESLNKTQHVALLKECTTLMSIGLTKLYNQFHNADLHTVYEGHFEGDELQLTPKELKAKSKETYNLWNHLQKTEGTIPLGEAIDRIIELRRLHKEMDLAVLAAYGWHVNTRRWGPAIKLRHDFYEVDYLPENDRVRYTIHPEARREVLKRLLLLNHEIHESEERGVPYEVIDGEKIVAIMREQVEAWLPGGTEKLHPKTLRFLCSGEDLWPTLERGITGSYKPFVTSYASALENELLEKVFVPFNAAFQSRWKVANDDRKNYLLSEIKLDHKLPKFCKMLLKEDTKYTLGDMQFILNMVYKTSGSTIQKSTLLQEFRAFVVTVYGEAALDKAFLHRVDEFVKNYRNEAAHTGEVSKELAEACRVEVRELVGYLIENEH